jgi:hypothetical protein
MRRTTLALLLLLGVTSVACDHGEVPVAAPGAPGGPSAAAPSARKHAPWKAVPPVSGPVKGLDALPALAPTDILVMKPGGAEAYGVDPGEAPVRIHTWPNATRYRLSGDARGRVLYTLVETPAGVEAFAIGAWDQPVLPAPLLQTKKIQDFYTIRPLGPYDGTALGLAVQEEGDAQSTGRPNPWRFFATADGVHWSAMKLRGVPWASAGAQAAQPAVLDLRRVGALQMALQAADGWHLFRRVDGDTWEAFDLAGLSGPLRQVESYDGGRILGVAPPGEGSAKHWFAWSGQGWSRLAEAIPGAPPDPVYVRSVVEDSVLLLRPGSGPSQNQDNYFVRTGQGWKSYEHVLPGAPSAVALSHPFGQGHGLAMLSAATAAAPVPKLSVFWRAEETWAELRAVPGLSPLAWDILPGGAHGFGIRTASETGAKAHSSQWRWVLDVNGAWVPLEQTLPADAGPFAQATIGGAALAVSIQVEEDRPDRPAVAERVFLRHGGRFVPWSDQLKVPWRAASLVDADEPEAIVRVRDEAGALHFLLQEGAGWADLSDQMLR